MNSLQGTVLLTCSTVPACVLLADIDSRDADILPRLAIGAVVLEEAGHKEKLVIGSDWTLRVANDLDHADSTDKGSI